MTSPKPDIAFIGLGAMGFGMATNLIKKGYPVTGFDVWDPTLERFKSAGGLTATKPAETVKDKSYVVCMVATAQQAQSVLLEGPDAAVPALPQGSTILLCSTVPCSYVQGLERQLVDMGRADIYLVDAPVSGGTYRAADGTLSIMAGASEAALSKSRFLLQEMSDPAKLYIGPGGVGAGSNLKMVHQVLAAVQILSSSEAMGFASHLGLDLPRTAEAINSSKGRSWMFGNRSPRMLHPEFQPVASALTIILKDTSIITAEARKAGFATPMSSIAEQVYFAGLGRGFGKDDDSSMIRVYTEGKGKVGPIKGGVESEEGKVRLVVGLLKGIHLCAAAETLALAKKLGLDLRQVMELCVNAAGGSYMLEAFGPEIVGLLDAKSSGTKSSGSLDVIIQGLQDAVEEAQMLKMPLYLGSQALNIARLALAARPATSAEAKAGDIVRVWGW
ncbi:NAD binding domain of 6-phosphogluconate dehydrogenase-domain-containing protein [Pseudomassariella vexata]|uniref:NAD binding domain of 6-phosphogluconate dehydrogenase-domain-containing protein n=1 Tax=Pseudomassariella vexata TaxID=1141098 RepID=A0A1Y2DAN5_9PEZI|nr:NAD binding domain of 6-phosphogluconate dehydrogenase-domain-containing protein [Pseudomassariella vexata]ORY56332.1 NAD binding domain of 6-phosphogluconate dehydrogenase-domain-containing protein [Pseudomassariella vexata]